MKIVLAEERDGTFSTETSFDAPVLIGRDTSACSLVFDSDRYPMVSRRHARISGGADGWVLEDLGSSFGTFCDGARVQGSAMLDVGTMLQFGEQGPRFKVAWLEVVESTASVIEDVRPAEPAPTPARSGPQGAAKIIFRDEARKPVELGRNPISIGREKSCSVVFESAALVSRRHAEIVFDGGSYLLTDNNSFNGTLLNGIRITQPAVLSEGDVIMLGVGGPELIFSFGEPGASAPPVAGAVSAEDASRTMVANLASISQDLGVRGEGGELVAQATFDGRGELTVGRAADCDLVLDGLQISNRHARFVSGRDGVFIEDLKSTNGVYVNGSRVSKKMLAVGDSVLIGSFVLRLDAGGRVCVFDARSKTRIDAFDLTKEVRNRAGGAKIRLLDGISLSIAPNEFIGLLGPSGAGKSTLMDALNGMRPATKGSVRINGADLYENIDSFKQSIGYVPQEDIIHRELTVRKTLFYVAKLRLSRDVSTAEIERIIEEVLDVTGLSERRDLPVSELSGGQRKRVSIAVELITKPSVIFLDEPTSGLDPATEDKIMRLFRQIADSGRTVIMTTHAMENVRLFDKVVVMMRGKLVFYGTPEEALKHVGAKDFQDLFDKLDDPVAEKVSAGKDVSTATEEVAEEWKGRFLTTDQHRRHIREALGEGEASLRTKAAKRSRLGLFGNVRQLATLTRRYLRVLLRDRLNLTILFAQAPIIALMTFFVMSSDLPRDFIYFVLALVSMWFGTSVAAREIVRERPVYVRERMVNLGLFPYVGSKVLVLGAIVGFQCLLMWVPLKFFDLTGLMPMPGVFLGLPQLFVILLTSFVGIALGLLISAVVRTSEMATSLVPLVLIPQILFSGLVGVPQGISNVAGLAMPAAWSFDSLKRYSALETLEPEGSVDGKGLYRRIEDKNDSVVAEARRNAEESHRKLRERVDVIWETVESGGYLGSKPDLEKPLSVGDVEKLPKDMSGFVAFKSPLMGPFVNPIILLLMFGLLTLGVLILLRFKDIG